MEKGQLIGLDIGLSAVKVCKLTPGRKGKFKIDHFAIVPLSEAAIIEDEIQKEDEICSAIATAIEDAGLKKTTIVCLGMDGPNTVTKRLQVPNGSKEDIEDNILWEADQYIPFDAEDSELDFSVVKVMPDEDIVDAIVCAIKADVAERYVQLVNSVSLNVKVVDLKVFALSNMLEVAYADSIDQISQQGAIVVDFGAQTTKVLVYKDGAPILTKEINIGGVLITEEIQRQMGLSYEEAEILKTSGDENGNLTEEVLSIIQDQLDVLLTEIKKVLNFFIAAGSSEQITNCFITGGSSRLPGLIEQLTAIVGIEVQFFNPFNYLTLDPKVEKRFNIEDIATMGVVAMGLGLRKI